MEVTVTDHPDAARYEITVDGEGAGFVTYRQSPGVITFTESPGSRLRKARPMGDVVEISPLVASAFSGITS